MQGCENANLTFILKILKIENVQKIPWSFCRRRKLPRTFSFPKATAFWGLMSPEAWVDGYLIFLIIVRSDHWPAWRSPCHRRSRSSQVTRPRWLRGGRRPEMPALIAGPTLRKCHWLVYQDIKCEWAWDWALLVCRRRWNTNTYTIASQVLHPAWWQTCKPCWPGLGDRW